MSTLSSKLYLKLLNGAGGVSPTMQKQIYATGIAESDSALLAALAVLPNLIPELDEAIGKRKSARELAAWCTRPGRSPADLRARIAKENRIQVLVAIAERPDLEHEDYVALAEKRQEKVSIALLRNPGVGVEAKKTAALSWVRSVSPNRRNHWRFRSEVEEVLSFAPDAYNELILHTTNREIVLAGMLNELSPEAQLVVLQKLVAPVLAEITARQGQSVAWNETRDADTMFDRLEKMIQMEFVTNEFRDGLLALLEQHGPWPKGWRYGYNHEPEKNRQKLVEELRSERVGTLRSPLHLARNCTDPAQLLVLAHKASQEHDESVALAVASNPASTTEVLEAAVYGLGWQGMRTVVRTAAERGEFDKAVVLLRANPYMLDDELFESSGNPPDLLRRATAALMQSGTHNARAVWTVLSSRFVTPEVLGEIPGDVIANTDLPEPVRMMLQSMIEAELGDDPEHWKLFEVLLATGDTPLKEVLRTAKAL